ncbi:MAG: GNAT family N-acetyltransferase [Candidatus Nanoarchaeia archaeon]
MDKEEIRELVESHLERLPLLYNWDVPVHIDSQGTVYIGGRTTEKSLTGTTHFDIQIKGDICYIMYVELEEQHRGQRHGETLYHIMEDIGRELGCKRIITTPLGNTITGESRIRYLLRRGYGKRGQFEVQKEL